jgi:hypothetical protein
MFLAKILCEFIVSYMHADCPSKQKLVALRMLPAQTISDSYASHARSIMSLFQSQNIQRLFSYQLPAGWSWQAYWDDIIFY